MEELVKKGGASQSQVDMAEATTQTLDAQIESAKQEVKRRDLDLEYSKITAALPGRIGSSWLTIPFRVFSEFCHRLVRVE